ncbi:ABC transporter substrate-binding protein [Pontibacillus halophilus JSM 076056 = DSM 19796]|uniref:Maltodextrin-binding protein n=1 Tax=Pontibacillus halophilus JSM 076056 = DSM 19796 TaxID=1385510 RepID=A0A0A5GNG6_9BACI|nr:extracellular solute-binding protein [Pontibacillus halophilus]KGX92715.1 ABC transporter substrate-binding protein [Pontibacillus halophilus JSM 076056 = DSM 19796]
MKKLLLLVFAMLLSVGVLAACSEDSGSDEASGNESNNEEGSNNEGEEGSTTDTLTIWVNDEESQVNAIEEITGKYTEETGIDVELTRVNMTDQIEKLDLDGPTGNGPDIFFQPHDRIGNIVLRGLAAPVDLGDETSGYSETAIEAVTYDGDVWGAPAVIETYALYYNKSLVDEVPATMEDLMALAEEQTEGGSYGFLAELNNLYFAYPFFAGNGGYVFDKADGSYNVDDIGLNNEGSVKGASQIQSFFTEGYIPAEISPDVINGLFTEGKAAVVLNGPWARPDYEAALGEDLATAPLPTVDGTPMQSFVGVKSWMLSEYSENKEQATDLIKFMTNTENSKIYYETAGEIPPRADLLEDSVVTEDAITASFAEQTNYGEPMPSVPEMSQIWEPMNNALQFLAQGDDPQEVMDETVQQIKDSIAAVQQ